MKGLDCENKPRDFFGLSSAAKFLLIDPLRNIATYDYANSDLDAVPQPPVPAQAIDHPSNDFGNARPEAVSAHYNAKVVYDFYNDVLKRDSVDDKGMQIVSVVNVYSSVNNPLAKPQWGNAVWWQGKMWYGQENGVSLAKHLDVIAHELTHGVTETSSKLIYRRLSGALNESFSDVFGIAIANWWPGAPNAVATWNWEIGPGLGANGGPIRDIADPARAGQPDHMDQYRVLPIGADHGGVHIYSGIHNKAVHLLMTATTATGEAAFPVGELMLLLYLTLTRLTPTSVFVDSRRTLENVVGVYHAYDAATLAIRLKAVDNAFSSVGII
jgi:bacillolysin/neutral peptidase B